LFYFSWEEWKDHILVQHLGTVGEFNDASIVNCCSEVNDIDDIECESQVTSALHASQNVSKSNDWELKIVSVTSLQEENDETETNLFPAIESSGSEIIAKHDSAPLKSAQDSSANTLFSMPNFSRDKML